MRPSPSHHRSRVGAASALVAPWVLSLVVAGVAVPVKSAAAEPTTSGINLDAVQGLLAVQRLDGWLLYDRNGQNPIALDLVSPSSTPTRAWFYLLPVEGSPVALVHRSEIALFDGVPGKKIEYEGYRDYEKGLRTLLKGIKKVAMEYSPKAAMPSLSRVDSGTVELVKAQGVKISSSVDLVQFTKAQWGPAGRRSHYLAAHHLDKLKDEALAFVAARIRSGVPVTEHDVQELIVNGYKARGLVGSPPVIAAGVNTANPRYAPTARASRQIAADDLLLIDMWARAEGARTIYAELTWMAYVGAVVPERAASLFTTVVAARDAAIALIRDRLARRRPIKGFEPDQAARAVMGKAGLADKFVHRTGHSLDTSVQGDGANLDDYEAHDTRSLVLGAGFTVGPGIYIAGDFGMRSEVSAFIGRDGLEVTMPLQTAITPLLAK